MSEGAEDKKESTVVPTTSARLTLCRMPNGLLMPVVDGALLEGVIAVQVASDPQNTTIVLAFNPKFVLFDSAPDLDRRKLN
jgi:hypothetical protein